MEKTRVHNIEYEKPFVLLMQETGIGTSEYAARTAYDSFDKSENYDVKFLNDILSGNASKVSDYEDLDLEATIPNIIHNINDVYHSDLLDDLAWTYFHHSVLEHANLTYLIKGISRGVLQELARHRIASYTVRSTRYTMSRVINAFNASDSMEWFQKKMIESDFLVTSEEEYQMTEWESVFKKLSSQYNTMVVADWEKLTMPKGCEINFWKQNDPDYAFEHLESLPKKRNIGDAFKHIVTDNWKVDLVMTMNIRSLKNFLDLRDSGSAWFQIRWLAEEIKNQTPEKYLRLISKKEAAK